MFKTQKPHKVVLPFKSRRQELAEEERKRNQFFVNRALDAAEGFSWSQSNNRPQSLAQRYVAIPLHKKVAAVASLLLAAIIIYSFLKISRADIEPQPVLVYAESWSADRTAEDALRDRAKRVAELRAEIAAREKAMADYQAKLAAERAAAQKQAAGAQPQQ